MSNGYTPDSPEQWRTIPGFPAYRVSDQGRVVSHKRRAPHVLRPAINPNGYLYVHLREGGSGLSKAIHSLVAEAFIGPRPEGLEVRHFDGDELNNAASNLSYGTHSENMRDRVRHGRDPQANRTHCPRDHEYTPLTTYINPKTGGRSCLPCRRAASAASNARRALRAAGIAA